MKQIVAVNTLAYHGYTLEEAFKNLASTGVIYVEPVFIRSYYHELTEEYFNASNARYVKKLIEDNGLSVYAMAGHMDLGSKGASDLFIKRMDFGKELGARVINTNAALKENSRIFFNNIEKIAEYAENIDIYVGFENPGAGENNILGNGKEGAVLIEKIGSERIGLNYDFGNTLMYSKEAVKPEEDFLNAIQYTIHLHLKDMIKERDGFYLTRIGGGMVNYGAILENIRVLKPDLPVSIELPLRFRWNLSYRFISDEITEPPSIDYINRVVSESLDYVQKKLHGD